MSQIDGNDTFPASLPRSQRVMRMSHDSLSATCASGRRGSDQKRPGRGPLLRDLVQETCESTHLQKENFLRRAVLLDNAAASAAVRKE